MVQSLRAPRSQGFERPPIISLQRQSLHEPSRQVRITREVSAERLHPSSLRHIHSAKTRRRGGAGGRSRYTPSTIALLALSASSPPVVIRAVRFKMTLKGHIDSPIGQLFHRFLAPLHCGASLYGVGERPFRAQLVVAWLDDVDIRQPPLFELSGVLPEGLEPVRILRFLQHMERRDAHADSRSPNGTDNGINDLQREPHTVLNRAAVPVSAGVDVRVQEGVEEVSVPRVDLDAVEARTDCVCGRRRKLPDHSSHVRRRHCLGSDIGLSGILRAEEDVTDASGGRPPVCGGTDTRPTCRLAQLVVRTKTYRYLFVYISYLFCDV